MILKIYVECQCFKKKNSKIVDLFIFECAFVRCSSRSLNGAHEFDTFDDLFVSLSKCLIPYDDGIFFIYLDNF